MALKVPAVLFIVSVVLWSTTKADSLQQWDEDTDQQKIKLVVGISSEGVLCDTPNPTDVSCAKLQDALYQDPSTTNCSLFFRCHEGHRTNCSCGQQQTFNANSQACTTGYQQARPCKGASHLGLCGHKSDGLYPIILVDRHPAASSSCDRYYECLGGKYRDHVCPHGTNFDPSSASCQPPNPLRKCPTTTTDHDQDDDDDDDDDDDNDYDLGPANSEPDECHERSDGKYAMHRGLEPRTHFYVCAGGLKMAQGSCLEGQSFVVELQRCVAPTFEQFATPSATTTPEDKDDCGPLADGYHPDLSRLCRRFYLCRGGQRLLEMTCPEGTHFDGRTQRCTDAPPTAECLAPTAEPEVRDSYATVQSSECAHRPDGYHPSSGSGCRRFVSCEGGQATSELTCPVGQAFDEIRGRCLLEHKVNCQDKQQQLIIGARGINVANDETENTDPECSGKSDDYYPDYNAACRSFIYCQNGHKTARLSCHSGQAFDQKTKNCQPLATGVVCSGWDEPRKETGKELEIEEPRKELEIEEDDERCRGKSDGYYGDIGRQCRRFHYCSSERVTNELVCARGQAFDDGARECLPEGQVDCRAAQLILSAPPSDPCPQMDSGGDDGFHPDYSRGCRRYVHCKNGSRVAEYLCTLGQLFDPVARRCLPRALVHCSAPPPGPPRDVECRWWDDGYYPSWDDGCRTYFYCRNGLKIVDLTCPSGQRYDSREKSCVDEKAAGPCDEDIGTTVQGRCTGKPDGAQTESDEVVEQQSGVGAVVNCSTRYFVCKSGSHQGSFRCPINYCFDHKSKRCEERREGAQQQDCRHRPDGSYSDLRAQCALYFRCRSGVRVGGGRCSPAQRFHPIRQMCLPQQRVPCFLSNTTPSPAIFSPQTDFVKLTTTTPIKRSDDIDGFHFHFENGCSRSTLCFQSEQSFLHHCGHQTVDCQVSTIGSKTSANAPMARGQPTGNDHFDCSAREDGHYVDATSQCRRWHVCSQGLTSTYECPTGSKFDLLNRRCASAESVDCSTAQSWVHRNHTNEKDTTTGPCHARPNGIYVDLSESKGSRLGSNICYPVRLCLGGQTYGINCPMSTTTDADNDRNCDTDDDIRCKQRPSDRANGGDISFPFNCSQRPDGYYLAPGQGCHVFHRCVGGHKFSHYCPDGQLFSFEAQGCDVKDNVECVDLSSQVASVNGDTKTTAGDVT